MELFDRSFPGLYLRLIRRVRVSFLALVPPTQGIRATLTASGISQVIVGKDVFQPIVVRRDPELIAFTSPIEATGVLELEPEGGMLMPFEGTGVNTFWEFRLPKAANPFDYRTIADVLISIEYTALYSADYRQQVIQQLDRNVSGDRPFNFRQQFADQLYDLHNPDQTDTPMVVHFETRREDFPPNIERLKIQHILLYFIHASGASLPELLVNLNFTEQGETEVDNEVDADGESASTVDGVISTRKANGRIWSSIISNKSPVGDWRLTLPDTQEVRKLFDEEAIEDILFVITFAGQTPEWPA